MFYIARYIAVVACLGYMNHTTHGVCHKTLVELKVGAFSAYKQVYTQKCERKCNNSRGLKPFTSNRDA